MPSEIENICKEYLDGSLNYEDAISELGEHGYGRNAAKMILANSVCDPEGEGYGSDTDKHGGCETCGKAA